LPVADVGAGCRRIAWQARSGCEGCAQTGAAAGESGAVAVALAAAVGPGVAVVQARRGAGPVPPACGPGVSGVSRCPSGSGDAGAVGSASGRTGGSRTDAARAESPPDPD